MINQKTRHLQQYQYATKSREIKYAPNFRLYEQLKQEWIAAHPDAIADEYCRAMREIANKAGI